MKINGELIRNGGGKRKGKEEEKNPGRLGFLKRTEDFRNGPSLGQPRHIQPIEARNQIM